MGSTYLPAVVKAKYASGFQLDITFDDGTQKTVDISQWFKGPVFEPSRKKTYFKKFVVEAASIAWPNGVDICPEALYDSKDVREAEKGSDHARRAKGAPRKK